MFRHGDFLDGFGMGAVQHIAAISADVRKNCVFCMSELQNSPMFTQNKADGSDGRHPARIGAGCALFDQPLAGPCTTRRPTIAGARLVGI